MTNKSLFLNGGRFEMEGSFDVNSTAAVLTLTNPDGSTKTVRGQHMSCAKTALGTYVVTVKLASSLDGQPVFQPIEVLDATANFYGGTPAGATLVDVSSVAKDANGNIAITVKTQNLEVTALNTPAVRADADLTAAVTIAFRVCIEKNRMDGVI